MWFVEAFSLYLSDPAFEPARHTPPGKGMITSFTLARMASAAASDAASPASWVSANTMKLHPATASVAPKRSSTMKLPSMTGIFQHFLFPTSVFFWKPSPKYLRLFPTLSFLFPGSPSKAAVVGQVRTH